MIIYEIDITLDSPMYDEYMKWLKKHISLMLKFKGFNNAKIYSYKKNDYKKHILVHYFISSIDDLSNYIDKNSNKMKNEGINRFNDSIIIKRRTLRKI